MHGDDQRHRPRKDIEGNLARAHSHPVVNAFKRRHEPYPTGTPMARASLTSCLGGQPVDEPANHSAKFLIKSERERQISMGLSP